MNRNLILLLALSGSVLLNSCGSGTAQPLTPRATHLSVTTSAGATVGAGLNVTVSALDASNNVVANYPGTVHFTSTDSKAALPVDSSLAGGSEGFSVIFKTAGSQTITVTDTAGGLTAGNSGSITVVTSPPATHFSVTAPPNAAAGTAFKITVSALDTSSTLSPSYAGTVHFTSTDGQAMLPPNATLASGTATFSATMKTAGSQTVTATDTVTTSVTGNSKISVSALGVLTITSFPPPGGTVGTVYGGYNPCPGGIPRSSRGFQFTASGGTPPFSWSGSSVPPGLTINPPLCAGSIAYGAIGGVPTAAGTSQITVAVTDSGTPKVTVAATYPIKISANAAAALSSTGELTGAENHPKHHMYKLIDIGTLGGPNSAPASPSSVTIDSGGIGTAFAATSIPDPYSPNCLGFDCLVTHAVEWRSGTLTDLGALPGANTSLSFGINDRGGIVGISENGLIDPLTGYPEVVAVYWKDGKIIDLGTFGGNASYANFINNEGQIVGMALNAIPDGYSSSLGKNVFSPAFPVATQSRAFLWHHGVMNDLGTLGGNDSVAGFVNDRGQVAGVSYTNTFANPSTGLPTQDPFFWEDGKMVDIGTLGGTSGLALGLNKLGQVVGLSNLAGDNASPHPFLWDKKEGLRDLGTLGGSSAVTAWVNDAGEVAGGSFLPGDQLVHAFFWKNGVMTDLGTVADDQFCYALSINAKGQVVGESGHTLLGWLWENGGPIVDLNQLVLPGSDLTVVSASYVNDRGEIIGEGLLPNGDVHAILLIPDGDCDDACEARIADSQINPTAPHVSSMPNYRMPAMRERLARRFHLPSPGPNN